MTVEEADHLQEERARKLYSIRLLKDKPKDPLKDVCLLDIVGNVMLMHQNTWQNGFKDASGDEGGGDSGSDFGGVDDDDGGKIAKGALQVTC